jgi:hypothetical protein
MTVRMTGGGAHRRRTNVLHGRHHDGTAADQHEADHERALTFTQGTTDEDEHAS